MTSGAPGSFSLRGPPSRRPRPVSPALQTGVGTGEDMSPTVFQAGPPASDLGRAIGSMGSAGARAKSSPI